MTDLATRIHRRADEIEARRATAPDCTDHPGNKVGFCDECFAAARLAEERREREEQRLAEVRTTVQGCDDRFPARYRCAGASHPTVLEWVEAAAKSRSRAGGLLLLGATGTGKTHQAYGALRALLPRTVEWVANSRTGYGQWYADAWRATTYADLNASMRPSPNADPEATLKANRDTNILLIDDLAAARTSEWAEEHLYRLINGRYEAMRPTIFTTNLAPDALREAVGDRIASRLVESCTRIVLDGPDLRRAGFDRPDVCPAHGIHHDETFAPIGAGDTTPALPVPRRPFWEN
jgi:DNA replication protein DnaC